MLVAKAFATFAVVWALTLSAFGGMSAPIMPLDEIKPGMQGTWKTAVRGRNIESFRLEILGTARNMIGPQHSVIVAEALDESQIATGTVAGMSGSPVYIGDRLIGAYAYGYTWPKDQALILITPIEEMMGILEKAESFEESQANGSARAGWFQNLKGGLNTQADWHPFPHLLKEEPIFADEALDRPSPLPKKQWDSGKWHWVTGETSERLEKERLNTLLKPLPTPLMAGGFSARTIARFQHFFEELGLELRQAPMGIASDTDFTEADLVPGAPVASVMMDGDFRIASVGTVTWREEDRFLAYGHKFYQIGDVAIPIAPAEVVTVVKSLENSFKLSNVGEVIGAMDQDRLTGISGVIGKVAKVTPFEVNVSANGQFEKRYQGNVFRDRVLSPRVAAMGLYESISDTIDFAHQQTYFTKLSLQIKGIESLVLEDVFTGPDASGDIADLFYGVYRSLLLNPFEEAEIERITVDIDVVDSWLSSNLKGIQRLSGEALSGGEVSVGLMVSHYMSEDTFHRLNIPIPERVKGQRLEILVCDGPAADLVDKGKYLDTIESLSGLADYIRDMRSRKFIYVKVLERARGLRYEGKHLFDLPPSKRLPLISGRTDVPKHYVSRKTIWETQIEMPGNFDGGYSLDIIVE